MKKQDGRRNNGGHSTKGKAGRPAGKVSDTVAITPRVLPVTAEKLRSIAEREKISIGKVIDAWRDGRLLE